MWKYLVAAVWLSVCLASATSAAEPRSGLTSPDLEGFVVGHHQEVDGQMIVEQIPKGETVMDWSRMITTQIFRIPPSVTPSAFANNIVNGLSASCPGAQASPVSSSIIDNRTAAKFHAYCPFLETTGKGESFYFIAVREGEFLHIKQAAFRGDPNAQLQRWAQDFIDATTFRDAD